MIDPEMHLLLDDHDGLVRPLAEPRHVRCIVEPLQLDRWVGIISTLS